MKTQIQRMKQELKQLASQIRSLKAKRKERNADGTPGSGYVHGLCEASSIYRHKHVAYCLLRGKKLEQCDSGDRLDMTHVQWYMDSIKEDSKHKLYVVVSNELTPSQQAVQAGHAVAQFLIEYPHTQWRNGYLIYLKDKPSLHGNMSPGWWLGSTQCSKFIEPDVGNKVTAYACFGPDAETRFRHHQLL